MSDTTREVEQAIRLEAERRRKAQEATRFVAKLVEHGLRHPGPDGSRQRAQMQMEAWARGIVVHNGVENECTPDFACCKGIGYLAPEKMRDRFLRDPASRRPMLAMWIETLRATDPMFALELGLEPADLPKG